MNWKLIAQLTLLGLAMELGSVFFIPTMVEPIVWLTLYVAYAYSIGKHCRLWRFWHGLILGVLNGIWITGTHEVFRARFLERHPEELALIDVYRSHGFGWSPRHIMAINGAASGLFWGVVVGVFAVVAGLMMKPRQVQLPAD